MSSSLQARMTRSAISPRLATRIRWNIVEQDPKNVRAGPDPVPKAALTGGRREAWKAFAERPPGRADHASPRATHRPATAASGRDHAKQRLAEFDRLAILGQDLDDRPRDARRNFGEDLHRLNDT